MTHTDIHASMCFRAGELAMLTLSRRISCLSTTTRNRAWCLMESSNSSWMRWGNRCQQPSASLDTRGEMDRFMTPVHALCPVRAKCHALHDARYCKMNVPFPWQVYAHRRLFWIIRITCKFTKRPKILLKFSNLRSCTFLTFKFPFFRIWNILFCTPAVSWSKLPCLGF